MKLFRRIFIIALILLGIYFLLKSQQPISDKACNTTQNSGLEIPKTTDQESIIKHKAYTLSYNEQHEQANWVAYELTEAETHKCVDRSNRFIIDLDIPTGTANNNDYKGSGFDRGHLAPAADMSWSEETMKESFYYSNISPQRPAFNRGIWKNLEELVRNWAKANGSIYIVTGPILKDNLPFIGKNVSIPEYYYKVILYYNNKNSKGIGFIIPNEGSDRPLIEYAVSIDSVQKVTHIDFFPSLPDDEERKIENSLCKECWTCY